MHMNKVHIAAIYDGHGQIRDTIAAKSAGGVMQGVRAWFTGEMLPLDEGVSPESNDGPLEKSGGFEVYFSVVELLD